MINKLEAKVSLVKNSSAGSMARTIDKSYNSSVAVSKERLHDEEIYLPPAHQVENKINVNLFLTIQEIKQGIIELFNSTKDKKYIIKELEGIYKYVIKAVLNSEYEDEEMSINPTFIINHLLAINTFILGRKVSIIPDNNF